MNREEVVRLPLWATAALTSVIIPLIVALLTDIEWRSALVTALLAVSSMLGGGELARSGSIAAAKAAADERELSIGEYLKEVQVQTRP